MNLREYQIRVAQTGPKSAKGDSEIIALLSGLAGNAGQLLNKCKEQIQSRDTNARSCCELAEEFGEQLWHLSNLASRFGLRLDEIAEQTLIKHEHQPKLIPDRPPFDSGFPETERFPRCFSIDISTTYNQNHKPVVQARYKNQQFGDFLTDNSYDPDGYSYHDTLHLSFAAVLGWSPLTRKLLNIKRKSNLTIDEIEDGGRAIATEEGISTMVFSYARKHHWLEETTNIDPKILELIRDMTAHLEVGCCTESEWELAILQGVAAWREMKKHGVGTLVVDLDKRSITFQQNVNATA